MKDFDDFQKQITMKALQPILDKVNAMQIPVEYDLFDTQQFIGDLSTATTAMSITAILELLKLYHQWLSEDC